MKGFSIEYIHVCASAECRLPVHIRTRATNRIDYTPPSMKHQQSSRSTYADNLVAIVKQISGAPPPAKHPTPENKVKTALGRYRPRPRT